MSSQVEGPRVTPFGCTRIPAFALYYSDTKQQLLDAIDVWRKAFQYTRAVWERRPGKMLSLSTTGPGLHVDLVEMEERWVDQYCRLSVGFGDTTMMLDDLEQAIRGLS